jgi:hypothetical protein
MKKIVILSIILVVVNVGFFSGCNEKSPDGGEKEYTFLSKLGFKVDDLSGNFEKTQENNITEPYTDNVNGSPLIGEYILEKYDATFKESNSSAIQETLMRFQSNDIAKNSMEKMQSFFEVDFPKQPIETIGEKSYLGKTIKTHSGTGVNISLYVLVFSKKDIVIILNGYGPSQDTFISYGKIIESNIMNVI